MNLRPRIKSESHRGNAEGNLVTKISPNIVRCSNNTSQSTLLIRADATITIGTGHIMRCLALAEAWKNAGGDVLFAMADPIPTIEARLIGEGMQIERIQSNPGSLDDANETLNLARKYEANWIVLDGYHFGTSFQKSVRIKDIFLLVIDDCGQAGHYYADVVLNQNVYADMSIYPSSEPYTRFLLGTSFALIRNEFIIWSRWKRENPSIAHRILVTFGGSDPENITLFVIRGLLTLGLTGPEVIIISGAVNSHTNSILKAIKGYPRIRVATNPKNIPELMAWADIAISASGSTCWELAFMRLPAIIYPIAENQIPIATRLFEIHAATGFSAGNLPGPKELGLFIRKFLEDQKVRRAISAVQKTLVDGTGAEKTVTHMRSISNGEVQ